MKTWKKTLALTIAASLTLGLTACGGGTGTGSSSGGSSDSGSDAEVNSAESKIGVFSEQEYDIQSLVGEGTTDYSVSNPTIIDDRLWFTMSVYDSETYSQTYYFVSMNTDGTDAQMIEPKFWQDGVNPYKIETAEETTEGEDVVADYAWESYSISNLTITADGQFIGIKGYYGDSEDEEGNYQYISKEFLSCWNADGSIAWDTELDGLQTDESYSYVSTIIIDTDGSPALLISGDQEGIMTLGEDGSLGEVRQSDAISSFIQSYNSIQDNGDGTLSVLYYDSDNWSDLYLATYDMTSDTLSEPAAIPSTITYSMQGNFEITSDGTLWYETGTGIYRYNITSGESEAVMNFVNSDLNTSYLDSMAVIDDEHIIGFYYKDTDDGYSVTTGGLFTYVAPEDIPDKVVVTIGTDGTDYSLRTRVVEFNKASDTTRIVIRDYSEYNSYDDYEAWKTQLNNDILSGNMPDILEVDNLDSLDSYVAKGVFANVDELIANDPELADTEFLDNAFEAYRIDGTLYQLFPSFYISTYIAKAALVGDKTSLTMEEAQEIVSGMGEDAKLIRGVTRDYFFNSVMSYVGREYVDVSTGTCNFDSDGFISLMEYAKTLQTEDEVWGDDYDEETYTEFYGDDYSQFRDNQTLLCNLYISDIADINYYLNGYFGEDISYVGFPNNGGVNGVIRTGTSYALSAESEVLDEAWDFISYYLKDEYQSSISYGLPVTRAAFDKMAQEALEKPYYEDEDGNKVEYDETYWLNDEEITLPTMTQAQVDTAVSFIESVTSPYYYDDDVIDIINEEIEAYYTDQKSAADVAAVIQSRVKIFVQENS